MQISLNEALNKVNLGQNYEKLGKNEGFFSGRTVLAFDKSKGWRVRHLNAFQFFF